MYFNQDNANIFSNAEAYDYERFQKEADGFVIFFLETMQGMWFPPKSIKFDEVLYKRFGHFLEEANNKHLHVFVRMLLIDQMARHLYRFKKETYLPNKTRNDALGLTLALQIVDSGAYKTYPTAYQRFIATTLAHSNELSFISRSITLLKELKESHPSDHELQWINKSLEANFSRLLKEKVRLITVRVPDPLLVEKIDISIINNKMFSYEHISPQELSEQKLQALKRYSGETLAALIQRALSYPPLQTLLDALRSTLLNSRKVVVSLSGGIDSSVTLLCAVILRELGEIDTISAVHVNACNRPITEQEQYLSELMCQKMGVDFYLLRYDEITRKDGLMVASYENSRKLARFGAYARVVDIMKNQCSGVTTIPVLLAHHTGDARENFFRNLVDVATYSNLGGLRQRMTHLGVDIYRPFFKLKKERFYDIAKHLGLLWTEDITEMEYTRIARRGVRNHLLPIMESVNPKCVDSIDSIQDAIADCHNSLLDLSRPINEHFISKEGTYRFPFRPILSREFWFEVYTQIQTLLPSENSSSSHTFELFYSFIVENQTHRTSQTILGRLGFTVEGMEDEPWLLIQRIPPHQNRHKQKALIETSEKCSPNEFVAKTSTNPPAAISSSQAIPRLLLKKNTVKPSFMFTNRPEASAERDTLVKNMMQENPDCSVVYLYSKTGKTWFRYHRREKYNVSQERQVPARLHPICDTLMVAAENSGHCVTSSDVLPENLPISTIFSHFTHYIERSKKPHLVIQLSADPKQIPATLVNLYCASVLMREGKYHFYFEIHHDDKPSQRQLDIINFFTNICAQLLIPNRSQMQDELKSVAVLDNLSQLEYVTCILNTIISFPEDAKSRDLDSFASLYDRMKNASPLFNTWPAHLKRVLDPIMHGDDYIALIKEYDKEQLTDNLMLNIFNHVYEHVWSNREDNGQELANSLVRFAQVIGRMRTLSCSLSSEKKRGSVPSVLWKTSSMRQGSSTLFTPLPKENENDPSLENTTSNTMPTPSEGTVFFAI